MKDICNKCGKTLIDFEGYGGHYGYEHVCNPKSRRTKKKINTEVKKNKTITFYIVSESINDCNYWENSFATLKEAERSLQSSVKGRAIWKIQGTLMAEFKLVRI